MIQRLTTKDIFALGFMTFALFVGAGNIIIPPMVGIQSGQHLWATALGFLITAVGLPVITIIALSRVGGGIDALSLPIGKTAGIVLATICYLVVGPLFATPRTATVSYEVGILPLLSDSSGSMPLLIYSLVYFALVVLISLYPGRLLDSVGHILAPLKMVFLTILGVSVLLWPEVSPAPATVEYATAPLSAGFVNGYLTMDTLGAMVFGIVIVNAARSRGVKDASLLTRYTIIAGVFAGVALALLYLSLFELGSVSSSLVEQSQNGAAILHTYVAYAFGDFGSVLLATLIFVGCMVTAVGLTCACAEFFEQYLTLSYRALVLILGLFSMLVSNLGLSHLIQFSIPVLNAIYPPCIILIILNFTLKWWRRSIYVIAPAMLTGLLFGVMDAVKTTRFKAALPQAVEHLPLANQGLSWLPPVLVVVVIAALCDRLLSGVHKSASL